MITRDIKYEIPELYSSQDPNSLVVQKQLKSLAGIVPLEFGVNVFDLLGTPKSILNIEFPDTDPISQAPLQQTFVSNIYNFTGAAGAKSATLIVGPSSNSDSSSYDYVTDGTADNVQIQAAIDALPTSGGKILLREGTYTLSTQVNVNKNNIVIQGMGPSTIIKPKSNFSFSTTLFLFNITGTNVIFLDLLIDGNNTTQTAHWALLFVDGPNASFHRCIFQNAGGFILFVDANTTTFFSCSFSQWGTEGSGYNAIERDNNLSQMVLKVINCTFSNSDILSGCIDQAASGSAVIGNHSTVPNGLNTVWFNACGGATIGNYFGGGTLAANGIVIVGDIGIGQISSNYLDFSGASNVTSIGIWSVGLPVTNNYISGVGIGITGSLVFTGNSINSCRAHGIVIESDNTIVSGNKIRDVGQATTDTYYSIALNTNVDHCVVNGNVCTNTATNKPKYCINEGTGCDKNIITSNVATGGVTGQINTVGANTVSANNITT